MADADDVRRLALALPHVVEIDSDGFDFRVADRGFVWSYPERIPGKQRRIRTDIAVLYVGDEAEKQALLLGEPELFFTTPAYDQLCSSATSRRNFGKGGDYRFSHKCSYRTDVLGIDPPLKSLTGQARRVGEMRWRRWCRCSASVTRGS
jgi:hypothetical protein